MQIVTWKEEQGFTKISKTKLMNGWRNKKGGNR